MGNKIFFHWAFPAEDEGLAEMYQAIDRGGATFAAYAVDSTDLFNKTVKGVSGNGHIRIYRSTKFDADPRYKTKHPTEAMAKAQWDKLKSEFLSRMVGVELDPKSVWLEMINEPSKEPGEVELVAEWLYAVAIEANKEGYKFCGPGWASGTPEPEAWLTPAWQKYLRLCAERPDMVAVTVHEYSYDETDIKKDVGWLVNRIQFIDAAAKVIGIDMPTIFITECGWTLWDTSEKAIDIEWLNSVYQKYPTVKAAFLWTLFKGEGEQERLAQKINKFIPFVASYTLLNKDTASPPPVVVPPVVLPPVDTGTNVLINPSFEDGWTDSEDYTTTQNPTGWVVDWETDAVNPHGGQKYQVGECVHKSKEMLPANERDVFVWDGSSSLKVFAGNKPFWVSMSQNIDTLPAGRYRLTTPVWVDVYKWEGGKNYNVDPNQVEMRFWLDGEFGDFVKLKAGGKREPVFEFDHHGGDNELFIEFRCNWGINNNLWLDGWRLELVGAPPVEPPKKYKAIVVKVPQNVSAVEWSRVADIAYGFRHDMTASDDSMLALLHAGNENSYVKMAYPDRQESSAKLVVDAGYKWEYLEPDQPTFKFSAYPVDGVRAVNQAFGARPEVYKQYGFPGHEGIDLRATLDAAVQAVADGVVTKITTTGNYGNRIAIEHRDGWETTYAHLNKFVGLAVGNKVRAGEVIGYAGTTGNSTGVHLHLTLKRLGHTYTDANGAVWPSNIFDPTPYIEKMIGPVSPPIVVPPPIVTPPLGLTYDLRRAFAPVDNGYGPWIVLSIDKGAKGTEDVQHYSSGADTYIIKGGNEEHLRVDATGIYRLEDTSMDDKDKYYALEELDGSPHKWIPAQMRLNEWHTRHAYVQLYNRKDCTRSGDRQLATTYAILNKVMEMPLLGSSKNYTVYEILVTKSKDRNDLMEGYWFAHGVGLIKWWNGTGNTSDLVDLPQRNSHLTLELPCK